MTGWSNLGSSLVVLHTTCVLVSSLVCMSPCTVTHPALGSVAQACTVKKQNKTETLHLEERIQARLRARSHLVLIQIIVYMAATESMK